MTPRCSGSCWRRARRRRQRRRRLPQQHGAPLEAPLLLPNDGSLVHQEPAASSRGLPRWLKARRRPPRPPTSSSSSMAHALRVIRSTVLSRRLRAPSLARGSWASESACSGLPRRPGTVESSVTTPRPRRRTWWSMTTATRDMRS